MPRCQRTFRYLVDNSVGAAGVWVCPHCSDKESYVCVRDPDLLAYASSAQDSCAADFGAPSDPANSVWLLWGVHPECVWEPGDRRYEIYLATGCDSWQARLQIGHELFHRVAGQGRVFHWVHEMLACVFAVRCLKQTGFSEYAERVSAQYQMESQHCSMARLLSAASWSEGTSPQGYYGRAFVVGAALESVTGYAALCRLARLLNHAAEPDVLAWLQSLPSAERNAAKNVLSNNT